MPRLAALKTADTLCSISQPKPQRSRLPAEIAMPDIVLATLNAKYIHATFGLRYLMANLGALRERAALLEFDVNQRPTDILETVLAREPKIVGLGVYIWNAAPSAQLVAE